MLERHRQGLCYNCDKQYVRGHVCPHFFFLESEDYFDDEGLNIADADVAAQPDESTPQGGGHC